MWVRRIKQELGELYGEANIVGVVKMQYLSWMGHMERIAELRMSKLIMARTVGGKKRR